MKKINRRLFLQGLGGFTLALPFMPSLLSKEALAATTMSPGIFIQLISPNAIDDKQWFPQLPSSAWTVLSDHAKRASLNSFTSTGISQIFSKEYSSQFKHYTFIRGLGLHAPKPGHHSGSTCLGAYFDTQATLPEGWIHNATLDKVLETSSKFYQDEVPIIKNLSVSTAQTHGASYTADGVRSTCYTNPRVVFDLLFGTSTAKDSNSQVNVLNSVMGDYTRVKNDSRISYTDKTLLEERMDMFADLQHALNNLGGNSCAIPERPLSYENLTTNRGLANATAHVDAMVQVCIAAIKCGLTRILVWNEMMPMGLLHYLHHGGSHGGDPNWNAQIEYQQWIQKHIFSKFVSALDVQDGTGQTYLDRAGIVHMLENGGNGIYHDLNNAYILCAGKMNGYLHPNHVYDYNHISPHYGGGHIINLPINCFWNQILQANGLGPSDYLTPGQKGAGFGYSETSWSSGYYKALNEYSALHAGGLLPFMKRT